LATDRKSLLFIPPKEVASYAVYKGGQFKVYDTLSAAKQRISWDRGWHKPAAQILEMVNGNWYVLYDVPEDTAYADLPWVKLVGHGWRRDGYERAVPMTRNEYAEWRVAVEREQIAKALQRHAIDPVTVGL
jgi:hypothetical protein